MHSKDKNYNMSESNPLLLEYSGQLYDFAEIAYNEFVAMKAAKRSAVLNLTPTNVIPTSFKCKTGGFSETITKLSWIEELTTILILLFALPGAIFSLPILTIIIGHFISNMMVAVMILCCFIFPLHFYPISFSEDFLYSWISYLLMKYFSFRVVVHNDAYITKRKLFIVACPPHGVFPFGNILALITFPFIFGFSLRGLAANSALHVPIMGQLMRSFGVISANNEVAEEVRIHLFRSLLLHSLLSIIDWQFDLNYSFHELSRYVLGAGAWSFDRYKHWRHC